MTIHTATKHFSTLLTAFSFIAVLAACGGGGSDNSPTPPAPVADTTPDAFTFAAVTDAAVNTDVSSAAINVSGINQATTISITGGTYSIAGGAFTNATASVSNGQSVVVKVTSSTATNTAVESVLTIGGVAGNFKVTTKPDDVTPDAFSFTAATGVVPKSVSTSSAITVAGIDIAVPISITGGEYSINDGAFTSAAGTVSKTQTVKVRGTASASLSANTNVELTIGGVKGSYSITTLADTVAPTAQILFPPPVSMTEGNTILVRGTASDDYSTIVSVKVNGQDVIPKAAGDFSTWQVNVTLTALADNNVIVTTEDSAGNKSSTQPQAAAQVMVRQGDHKNAFPSDDNNLTFVNLAIDRLDGRNRLLGAYDATGKMFSVDIATGKSTLFADLTEGGTVHRGCSSFSIEPISKHLYCTGDGEFLNFNLADASYESKPVNFSAGMQAVAVDNVDVTPKLITDDYDGFLMKYDIGANTISVFSDAAQNIPDSLNPLAYPTAIILDKAHDRYLVANGGQEADAIHAIFAVDRKTGARTVFSGATQGAGVDFTSPASVNNAGLLGLALDETNNRVLVTEAITGRILAVDLTSGDRSLLSDKNMLNMPTDYSNPTVIQMMDSSSYAFVVDPLIKGVYAVDLVTGQHVIFFKSASTN